MINFLNIFLSCLIGIIAFFIAIVVVAIIWYVVFPFIMINVMKIFKYFNKLSDKLFKNIKKQ